MDQVKHARQVRYARPTDLNFILDLTRKNTEALGFIPQAGVEQYLARRGVVLALENDTPAGFLLGNHAAPENPGMTLIHQACICYDARRRALGLELVARVAQHAAVARNGAMQLWCRGELDANDFWRAAGFEAMGLRSGGDRRGIPQILWRRAIVRNARLDAAPSVRRRGRAGTPVIRPAGHTTQTIMNAAQAGELQELLDSWLSLTSELSEPRGPALPADYTNEPADIEPLNAPHRPTLNPAFDLPADAHSLPLWKRHALTGGSRLPPHPRAA